MKRYPVTHTSGKHLRIHTFYQVNAFYKLIKLRYCILRQCVPIACVTSKQWPAHFQQQKVKIAVLIIVYGEHLE